MKINMDEKLSIDKFYVDEENAHIIVKTDEESLAEYKKLVIACPAGLYKLDESGKMTFDYAGCLECGTCRVLCGKTIIEKWEYPRGTLGIEFRFG